MPVETLGVSTSKGATAGVERSHHVASDSPAAMPTSALTLLPFATIAIIGQLIAFPSPAPLTQHYFWSSSTLLAVRLVGFCVPYARRSAPASLALLLSYVASVGLLMLAEGGAATGSGTLFLLPVIAAALFLGYREAV